jgi:hypothetical protein
MLSPGGKVIYYCPKCWSLKIDKTVLPNSYAVLANYNIKGSAGICRDCSSIFKWSQRVKISVKADKKKLWDRVCGVA